jgi:MoaA/NifB/PqqE/SkfB family radical SAM enzyme
MLNYKDLRSIHLEISSRCNAACPDCLRNYRGVDIIDTYPVRDMSLEEFKEVFSAEFLQQLDNFKINGNYGDFVTARDGVEIVEYIVHSNPKLSLEISTNASAKPKIWERLAKSKPIVYFRLDGLGDTHRLYRQNTDFEFILDNAQKFIRAGGEAVWAMIKFDHNQHQIDECERLSRELGFSRFDLVDAGRNTMPVFTQDKRLSHVIGDYRGSTNFDELYNNYKYYEIDPTVAVMSETENREISCYAKKMQEVYVASNGEVYPCCWLGYYPLHSNTRPSSAQLKPLIMENNAIEYGLEHAIAWFNKIEESWDKTVPTGKIYECNQTCGIK